METLRKTHRSLLVWLPGRTTHGVCFICSLNVINYYACSKKTQFLLCLDILKNCSSLSQPIFSDICTLGKTYRWCGRKQERKIIQVFSTEILILSFLNMLAAGSLQNFKSVKVVTNRFNKFVVKITFSIWSPYIYFTSLMMKKKRKRQSMQYRIFKSPDTNK